MKNLWRMMPRSTSSYVLKGCAALILASAAAYGGPIRYTFTGTTLASLGSPSHSETFQLTSPDFLPVVLNGPVLSLAADDPAISSCVPCNTPPVPAVSFLHGSGSDLIQFNDQNGTNYVYFFPESSLSAVGTYQTSPGININVGTLTVEAVPEPSTASLMFMALTAIAAAVRRHLRPAPVKA